MKKAVPYFGILLLILAFIQTYNFYKNNDAVKSVAYFDLQLELKQHSFSKNNNYILYFDPDCGHCSEILKKIPYDKNSSILFITPNKNIQSIKSFIKKNDVNFNSVLIDLKNDFAKDFGLGFIVSIPTVLIINNDKVENITHRFNSSK